MLNEKEPLSTNPGPIEKTMGPEQVGDLIETLIKNDLRINQEKYGEEHSSIYEAESRVRLFIETSETLLEGIRKYYDDGIKSALCEENIEEFEYQASTIHDLCIGAIISLLSLASDCIKKIKK